MVHIEIDGVKLQAEQGSMIIEAADTVGIEIPRFCYHKKLSVAANCRMCLVEVANAPKAVPACATPVSDGMVVRTQSERAKDAQKSVMEFLLINHPLDCPICDQGGECELQDLALGYGRDVSRFTERKRVVKDKNIGPLIATDMTRCIHCTRCVRFGQEIAGIRELGATGRGEHMEIGTYIEKSVASEVSGNVIDLCPVGALTAKPSRFQARAWEMEQHDSIAPHDCIGSNVHVHTRRGEVIRVVPKENEAVNEVWLSDRDRFSYQALNEAPRALKPMIRENGELHEVDWQRALEFAVERLNNVKQTHGAESIGALVSPSASCEEMHLLKRLMSDLGSDNIDFRLRYRDDRQLSGDAYPSLGIPLAELEHQDTTLLVAANLRKEQPIAALRLRKSTWGGEVMAINGEAVDNNFKLSTEINTSYAKLLPELLGVAAALHQQASVTAPANLADAIKGIKASSEQQAIADKLLAAENAIIILGEAALHHSQASEIEYLSRVIADMSNSQVGQLSHGANVTGAYHAGILPGAKGASAKQMLSRGMKAFVLLNCEPEHDAYLGQEALTALQQSDCVISLSAFADGQLNDYAHVVLPVAGFTETSGTFVNTNGLWQSFAAATGAKGEARPAWKVLRVLGNLFSFTGYDYVSSEEVLNELKTKSSAASAATLKVTDLANVPLDFSAQGESARTSLYKVDPLVRRADALQQTQTVDSEEKA